MLKFSYNADKITLSGNVSDCTVRALATVMGTTYSDAEDTLTTHTDYTRKHGTSTNDFHKLLVSLGFKYVNKRVRLTGQNAAEKLPKTAILHFREHVCGYKDGTIYDAFIPMNFKGCKQAHGYWTEA